MCHDNEEWCKIWSEIDLSVQTCHKEFDKFWPEHSKISQICTLIDCFWPRYVIFELKNYRGVMFDGTEDWCKIWNKTDLCFLKWHEEFGKFSLSNSNYFTSTKKCRRGSCIMDFTSAKMEFASAIFKKLYFFKYIFKRCFKQITSIQKLVWPCVIS